MNLSQTCVRALLCLFFAAAPIALHAQGTYTNPISSAWHADPYVLVWNGKYYFSDTGTIGRITYDTHLENVANGSGSCTINLPSGYQGGEAPEMLEWQGHAYYFYTSTYNVGVVLKSDSADPCGNYTTLTTSLFSGGWDIDMFVRADGTLWAAAHMGPIQIVQMADPATPMTSPVTIVDGTQSWETGYIEGPEMFEHDGKIYMDYSAGNYLDDTYKLGLMTFTGGPNDRLDNASLWVKSPTPVFQTYGNVLGPGHNTVVVDAAGQYWNLYHAHDPAYSLPSDHRQVSLQAITWDSNGNPVYGTPVQRGVAQTAPAAFGTVSGPPIGRRIAIVSTVNGQYLSLGSGDNIQANGTSVGTAQQFNVVSAGGNSFALQSVANGLYVSVNLDYYDIAMAHWATSVGSWETFNWNDLGNNNFAIFSPASHYYLSNDLNNANNETASWATSVGSWEQYSWIDEGPAQ